jgi:hypothetical protein
VVLRVMGSAGRPRGDAKSFFGLSDAEAGSDRSRFVAVSRSDPLADRRAGSATWNVRAWKNRIVRSVVALLLVICAISYWIF